MTVESAAWMGGAATKERFAALPEVEEAHIAAGAAPMLVKIRVSTTEQIQGVLREIFAIGGVQRIETTVVLETVLDRPLPLGDTL